MKNGKILVSLLAGLILIGLGACLLLAQTAGQGNGKEKKVAQPAKNDFTIRKFDEQVVLYTLYRGPYDKMGPAIGQLFALAGKNQLMPPKGPLMAAFLNNPHLTEPAHYLSELRLPVDPAALKLASTLGPFTDVKKIPAMEVLSASKPAGVADPAPIYKNMHQWIMQNGYTPVEGPFEIYLTPGGDYASMKTEILMPVEKIKEMK